MRNPGMKLDKLKATAKVTVRTNLDPDSDEFELHSRKVTRHFHSGIPQSYDQADKRVSFRLVHLEHSEFAKYIVAVYIQLKYAERCGPSPLVITF